MKISKLAKVGVVSTAAALLLAACGSSKSASSSNQVLNWDETAELPTMDLSTATDVVSFNTLNNTMEGLYRIGKDSKITPGIATKTSVSKDGLTYTFDLRKDAKWSNGDKVTAKDFVYSWQRTVNPKTGSQYAFLFDGIKNANDVLEGKKPVTDLGIKAEGDYKLVVTLDKQVPYFKLLMGFPVFFPQNQKVVEKYGDKYGTASKYMVYNGPFKLTKWTGSNLSWTMAKNDNYWDKKDVKLSAINVKVNKSTSTSFNLYQSGKLDATPLSVEQAKQVKNQKDYVVRKDASTFYFQYNQEKDIDGVKAFQNQKIRQAISLVINRKQFVNKVLGSGTVATGLVSAGLASNNGKDFSAAANNGDGVTYDVKKAQKLWAEGLKELGVSSLNFSILSDDTDGAKKSTEFLQSAIETNLKGAKVTTANVPFKTRINRTNKGDFDIVLSAWGADFSDPISFLDLFTSDNANNAGKWSNQQYDELIAKSKNEDANDPDKRWNDLVQAQQILMGEEGISPIYNKNTPWLVKTKVKGIIYNTAGVNYNFKDAYIQE
ncbi:peptide ABC transporter substrate-binding protein [Ligilactobacillus equi]|uniref:Oligopeptide ABC superfamily ATP binding cassette transporter, binding protein n=1 Tax=Ligilactobacillus equi DSM 15833 = JCM 10991 TaxID=1423740 RepID=A0A0R1TBE6_9LACO|nr:peptide ABC transporter substrate-binding protein [Ligilactobacillus equi]KRL78678.1 oligopeptide ABC superfamily ATP binding cassette transporter, binding protein [Ligilactobacillus equi DSM 15833 = JCM 10991]